MKIDCSDLNFSTPFVQSFCLKKYKQAKKLKIKN